MEDHDPANFYAKGCIPDAVLVLRDAKGNTVCRLRAVKAILSSWSPVLRNALELSASPSAGEQRDMHLNSGATHSTHSTHTALIHSNSSGCLASYVHGAGSGGSNCGPQASAAAAGLGCGSSGGFITNTGTSSGAAGAERGHAGEVAGDFGGGASSAAVGSGCVLATHGGLVELPVLVDNHKEVEAWKVAMCLMHPLDPTCGRTPSSLVTTCAIKPLVTLADKYNLAGLLPYCKDMLMDPRSTFGVPGIHESYKLDALEWIQIAESVPGFEAVVVRCITQIVASATTSRGRSQRLPGGLDQPRYRGHEALMSAMSCLRPETCAKLASSLASCLAVACENMANQDRYSIKPVGEHTPWGWEYQYEPLRK